jgi:hypothetical protein
MLVLRHREPDRERKFRAPAAWPVGIFGILGCLYLFYSLPNRTQLFFLAAQVIGLVSRNLRTGAAHRARPRCDSLLLAAAAVRWHRPAAVVVGGPPRSIPAKSSRLPVQHPHRRAGSRQRSWPAVREAKGMRRMTLMLAAAPAGRCKVAMPASMWAERAIRLSTAQIASVRYAAAARRGSRPGCHARFGSTGRAPAWRVELRTRRRRGADPQAFPSTVSGAPWCNLPGTWRCEGAGSAISPWT